MLEKHIKQFKMMQSVDIIKENGFNPIGLSYGWFEPVFIFETSEEANRAYNELEDILKAKVIGLWYGKEEFDKIKDAREIKWL